MNVNVYVQHIYTCIVVPFDWMHLIPFEMSAGLIFVRLLLWFNVRCCVRQFAAVTAFADRFDVSALVICMCLRFFFFSLHIQLFATGSQTSFFRFLSHILCTAFFSFFFILHSKICCFSNSGFFPFKIEHEIQCDA